MVSALFSPRVLKEAPLLEDQARELWAPPYRELSLSLQAKFLLFWSEDSLLPQTDILEEVVELSSL